MSLSLTQQSENKCKVDDPGVVVHSWLKELYFEYKNPNQDVVVPDNVKDKILEYLQITYDFKDKRNWEGADQQYRNNMQFAKSIGVDLDRLEPE